MTGRRILSLTALGGLAFLLLLASPFGTYVAGAVLTRVAAGYGWHMRLAATSGWLAGRPTLHGLRLRNEAGDVAVERIALSPWYYRIDIERVIAVVTLGDTAASTDDSSRTPGPSLRLPIGQLPAISLTGGVLELRDAADSLLVGVEGVDVETAAVPETVAQGEPAIAAELVLGRLQVAGNRPDDPLLSATGDVRLRLTPDRIAVEQMRVEALLADETVAVEGEGILSLREQWPVEIDLRAEGGDLESTWHATARAGINGTLSPVALRGDLAAAFADSMTGEVRLSTGVALTDKQVALDSATVAALGGQLRLHGIYAFEEDSATVAVDAAGLQIDRLGPGFTGAVVDGGLTASAQPVAGIYAGSLQARVSGVRVLGETPRSVEVRAELSSSGHLDATAESDLGRLHATGQIDLSAAVSYDLALEGHLAPAGVMGPAVTRLAVSGRLRPDDVEVRLRAAQLAYLRGGIGPAGLDLRLRDGHQLSALFTVEGSQAQASLEAGLGHGQLYTLEAEVLPLPMDRILAGAGGDLSAQLSAGGALSLSGTKASGRLELADLQLSGWNLGDVSADLTLETGRAQIELTGAGVWAVAAADTSGEVAGQAQLSDAVFARETDANSAGPDQRISASGRARWSGNLHADLIDWQADLNLDSLATTLYGSDLRSDAPVRIRHENRVTTIERVGLRTPVGLVAVAGTLGDRLDLFAAVDSLTPAQTIADLAGTGSARFDLAGTWQEPRAAGRISLRDLTLAGRPIGDVEARLALADSLSPDSLVAVVFLEQPGRAGQAVAHRSLSISFSEAAGDLLMRAVSLADDPRASLRVEAVDFDATAITSYVTGDSLWALLGMRSAWSLPARALGALSQVDGELEISRLDFGNAGVRIGLEGGAVVRLARGSEVEMPAAAVLPIRRLDDETQLFEAAGRLLITAARTPGRTRLGIDLEEVELRVVEPLTSGAVELPGGMVDASLVVVDSTQGTGLELTSATYLDDLGELLLESSVSSTHMRAQAAWVTPVLDSLVVSLDVPWRMEDRLVRWELGRLRARSDGINLFLLLDQFPQLQSLDGLVRLDVDILGLADRSQARGQIEVEGLELSLLDVSPGFAFPSGAMRFDGTGRGEIAEFVGGPRQGGRGLVELAGFVDLAPLADPDYDLVLVTRDMPYRYEDTFNAPGINLQLAVRRTATGRLLSGDIAVNGASVEPTILNFNATSVPPPPALKSPFLETTALDVRLDLNEMKVKNELTDLLLEGSSSLYGTFYKPRFQGEIQLLQGGKIIVLSREFAVSRGRIVLDRLVPTHSILDLTYDPLLLDPELDIEAVARVWSYDAKEEKEVTMTLLGTALHSQPRFSSPGLGDNEVISLLAFGSSSFRTDDLYTAAGQLLLGGQVSKVGLDEFSLLPSGTVMGGVGETSVRIGKFFSFPLPIWVRYETPASLPSKGQVELEYNLGSHLTIRASSQSEHGLYGAGVGVKKSF